LTTSHLPHVTNSAKDGQLGNVVHDEIEDPDLGKVLRDTKEAFKPVEFFRYPDFQKIVKEMYDAQGGSIGGFLDGWFEEAEEAEF